MTVTPWAKKPWPGNRFTRADLQTRCGFWPGLRYWLRQEAGRLWRRAWYRYWERRRLPPGDTGEAGWFEGRRYECRRTAWWRRPAAS